MRLIKVTRVTRRRRARIAPRCGLSHADKDGHLVLRWNVSWRNVNGFFINTKLTGAVWFTFRRHGDF